ncbi:MAG: LPS export ABC transporter periplasmic protein LptC [Spirosomaceae bacterium]|jgi:LPS export ABC transporter protein LptC|nr:LPS export ABC transporter periplasmic protein LptC [Spirosomataceae bacterium]
MKYVLGILVVFLFWNCEEKKEEGVNYVYQGPLMTTENLSVMYSDSGNVKVKMNTAKQLKMQNEDEIYPKAIYVNFIDKNGVEYSSLRGDSARFFKAEQYYKIMGNVFFFNRLQQQSLSTTELIWSPIKRRIYSTKSVSIKTPTEEVRGVGLDADQDFTKYTIRKPTGVFAIDSVAMGNDTTRF